MIPVASFAGTDVAVFGLGASGRATATALVAGGAAVTVWDDNADAVAAAADEGLQVADLDAADWRRFVALVIAPGVPLTHPAPHWAVRKARDAGIEVIGDIELFCRERRRTAPAAPFIAITGTNGKSTTTALIAHILAKAGRDVQYGGNLGPPILSLEPPRSGRVHVVEVSSFQIDLAPSIDPTIAVLLNVTADHLDRHGTFAGYAAIKERLATAAADVAVVAVDDNVCQAIADRRERKGGRTIRVSARRPLADGIYADGGTLFEARAGAAGAVATLGGVASLRGAHNAENAAAAAAAARQIGLDWREIAAGVQSFPGLAHRMEEIGQRGHVRFVNDSKATNADAAAKALASFGRVYWIAGGRAKVDGISSLVGFLDRIAKVYLIGEAAPDFAETLGDKVPFELCGTLAVAVASAARDAARDDAEEPVVLLSPAAASYDQFRNFEHRGEAFRALADALDGMQHRGRAA